RLVEQPPRRADERTSLDVLAVAGLLADQHDARLRGASAEHALGRVLPKPAAAAAVDGGAHGWERHPLRKEIGCAALHSSQITVSKAVKLHSGRRAPAPMEGPTMGKPAQPDRSGVTPLRALLDVTRLVGAEMDLHAVLEAVADTISETL